MQPDLPRVGVYVHFPYCTRHCPYCDFNVAVARTIPHDAYRDAVIAELAARAPAFAGRPPAVSVYFGGGTPGLWRPDCVGAVVDAVAARLGLRADAEVTVECNPEDLRPADLAGLRAAGANRLSLGVQTFDDARLARLGRGHRGDDARRAVAAARAAGFDDLSLDLIHGLAGQTTAEAVADVDAACALAPTHVSTYQLTIEPKTAFGARARRGETLQAPEEALLEMFLEVRAALRGHGVVPYEISNAARPGHEAVHNGLYWTLGEYVGLGAGAHGFRRVAAGGERWENERHAGRYVRAALAGAPAERGREVVDPDTLLEERVMTGLRLDRGLPVDAELAARFGARAAELTAAGLLRSEEGRWAATERGRPLLDTVIGRLIGP